MVTTTHSRSTSSPGAVGRPEVEARAEGAAAPLTWALAILVAAGALVGLLVDGVYRGAESTAAMLRAYDLVTLLVAVPGLAVSAALIARRSEVAALVRISLIAYVVYSYAYYLFGTGFNDLFLLHAAVLAVGLVALVRELAYLDVEALAARFGSRTRVRTIAGILGVLTVALGGMWVFVGIDNALNGGTPDGSSLVETPTMAHLGMALDLTLLVPLYGAAAVLLWQRRPWGYALAALALLPGVLHQVGYMAAMPFQVSAHVPGAVGFDPAEPVIVLLYVVGAGLLVRGAGRPNA